MCLLYLSVYLLVSPLAHAFLKEVFWNNIKMCIICWYMLSYTFSITFDLNNRTKLYFLTLIQQKFIRYTCWKTIFIRIAMNVVPNQEILYILLRKSIFSKNKANCKQCHLQKFRNFRRQVIFVWLRSATFGISTLLIFLTERLIFELW